MVSERVFADCVKYRVVCVDGDLCRVKGPVAQSQETAVKMWDSWRANARMSQERLP